ncbi:MAG: phospholipase A [Halofilum sp. (in: g-proteobacteria)]
MRAVPARGVVGWVVVGLCVLGPPVGAALVADDWATGPGAAEQFQIVPHRPVYFLPLSINEKQGEQSPLPGEGAIELDHVEAMYQVSVKTLLAPDLLTDRGDLWLGYTQKGWWQAYNGDESHPVRETNYEPELIYAYRPSARIFGVEPALLTVRLNHLSDGRGRWRSRAFNRLGAGLLFDDGEQAFEYRAWYPLPSSGNAEPDEVADYFGRVQFDWYRALGEATVHLRLRNNLQPDTNRSTVVIDYRVPTDQPRLDLFVEYRHGYGDAMVDFDQASNRVSVGVALARWP